MVVAISPEEKQTLIVLLEPYGRVSWFMEKSGINSSNTLTKLRTLGRADEEIVKKMRAAFKDKEVRELIKAIKNDAATA